MTAKTRLIQIGNSRGIRVPKILLDHAALPDEVEVRLDQLRTVGTERLIKRLGRLPSTTVSETLETLQSMFAE